MLFKIIVISLYNCYFAYIWIYIIENKLSQNVEGGSYDSGNVASVWVSWPSTDIWLLLLFWIIMYTYIYTDIYISAYIYAFYSMTIYSIIILLIIFFFFYVIMAIVVGLRIYFSYNINCSEFWILNNVRPTWFLCHKKIAVHLFHENGRNRLKPAETGH